MAKCDNCGKKADVRLNTTLKPISKAGVKALNGETSLDPQHICVACSERAGVMFETAKAVNDVYN